MHPLVKRILVNSLIAGSLLAVMGYGLAELGRMWLVAQTPARAQPGVPAPTADDTADVLGTRVPLVMAGWGVACVALSECFLWFVLKRRPKPKVPPAPPGPDPAEALLEQLLREAEAKQALTTTPLPAAPQNETPSPVQGRSG
jgi:hypothetical protein